jgi:hypothetical protein
MHALILVAFLATTVAADTQLCRVHNALGGYDVVECNVHHTHLRDRVPQFVLDHSPICRFAVAISERGASPPEYLVGPLLLLLVVSSLADLIATALLGDMGKLLCALATAAVVSPLSLYVLVPVVFLNLEPKDVPVRWRTLYEIARGPFIVCVCVAWLAWVLGCFSP